MATTKEFKDFICEQLSEVENLVCKPMMGEFLLYCNGVLFGGIYDGRLLIKKTATNKNFHLPEVLPYKSAKRTMYFVEDLENTQKLKQIILETCKGL